MSNKAIYVALGINLEGQKELLGLWLAETECAMFWLIGVDGTTALLAQGHLHRRRGWPDGLPGGD